MNLQEVKISLSKEELEGFSLMCSKQLDALDRSIQYLKEDDTSYNSFEKMKLESRRAYWRETHQKIINGLEIITTVNRRCEEHGNGKEKIVHHMPRAD